LTFATASGLRLLSLAFHVATGVAALAAGYVAIAARKGGTWHRRSGVVFVYAIIAMGLTAVGIAVYEGKDDVAGGALTAYLVFTAWTTVKPLLERAGSRTSPSCCLHFSRRGGIRPGVHGARQARTPDRRRSCRNDVLSCPQSSCSPPIGDAV